MTKYIDPSVFAEMKTKPTRDAFGLAACDLGEQDSRITVLTADVAGSVRANWFQKKFPERFYDLGIAEQNMVAVAAGMAQGGLIPLVSTFGVFLTGRVYDQVRMLLAYSQTNVKLVATHCGVTVGEDGASHQMLEDVALMSALPNMQVIVPCDMREAYRAIRAAAAVRGPFYIRLGRHSAPLVTTEDAPFETGRALMLQDGADAAVIANGIMVYEALIAARQLASEGVSVRVLNMHTVKPLDETALAAAVRDTGALVTAEEHQIYGGLASAVALWSARNMPVPMEAVGIKDEFGCSGTSSELMDYYHLRADDIADAVRNVLKRKS